MAKRGRSSACARALRAALACAIGLVPPTASGAAERIPLADFFRAPELTRLALSPDGRWLAAIAPAYTHQFGAPIAELSDIGARLRDILRSGRR